LITPSVDRTMFLMLGGSDGSSPPLNRQVPGNVRRCFNVEIDPLAWRLDVLNWWASVVFVDLSLVRNFHPRGTWSPWEISYVQSSIRRPGTRMNSLRLFVTRMRPFDRACPEIIWSYGPIGVPALANSARNWPVWAAASSS